LKSRQTATFTQIAFCEVIFYLTATAGRAGFAGEVEVIHDIPYRTGVSRQWKLDLAKPKPSPGQKARPGIVVIHGGGWLEGDKSSFASREFGVPGNIVDFAEAGFVAITINYRLSGEARYPAALDDCKTAVRWFRAQAKKYNLDPDHIGAFGNSAGGHLALLLGMAGDAEPLAADALYRDQSSRVQAVASDSGPIDLTEQHRQGTLRTVVERFMGGRPEGTLAAAYRNASPIEWIKPGLPPLMLIYGVNDTQVPVGTADRFVVSLESAGLRDLTYLRLAAVDHCPYSLVRVPFLRTAVNDFFVRTLITRRSLTVQ
jgi:acetyl esterase/lipase